MNERECSCGMPYTDTADGRWQHRLVWGHTPNAPRGTAA